PLGSSRPHKYTCASEPTPSRLPTIHLSKNLVNSLHNPLRLGTGIFPSFRLSSSLLRRSGEADDIAASVAVNRCREEFFQPFAASVNPRETLIRTNLTVPHPAAT